MWQKGGSEQAMNFEMAHGYIESLNSQQFANYDDWRLPTFEEVMSLMEPKKQGGYYIVPIFEAAAPFIFSADQTPEDKPWVVYYYDGFIRPELMRVHASVRAVRTND